MSQDDFDTGSISLGSEINTSDPYYNVSPNVMISPNSWTINNWSTTQSNLQPWTITDLNLTSPVDSGKIKLEGENADIEVNGRSLMGILDGLEQRLGLLKCREDLESEWEELKALGDQYRAKLAEIENKQKMWETLKR